MVDIEIIHIEIAHDGVKLVCY